MKPDHDAINAACVCGINEASKLMLEIMREDLGVTLPHAEAASLARSITSEIIELFATEIDAALRNQMRGRIWQ